MKGKWIDWNLVPFCSNLYKADTWLKRTAWCGPAGVRFNQVLLYSHSNIHSHIIDESPCIYIWNYFPYQIVRTHSNQCQILKYFLWSCYSPKSYCFALFWNLVRNRIQFDTLYYIHLQSLSFLLSPQDFGRWEISKVRLFQHLKRHARDFFYWTFIQQIVDCFASSSRNRGKISDSVYFWSFSHQFNLPTIFNQIMRAESYMACVMSQEMTTFSGHSLSWSLPIAWYWSSVQWRSYESLCKLIVRKWKYLSFPVPPIEHTVTQLQRATFPRYTRSPWSFQFLHDKPVNLDDNSTNMNQTLISGAKYNGARVMLCSWWSWPVLLWDNLS